MVTLTNREIEQGLEILEKLEKHLIQMPDTRVRNFIRGTLREYRFHLFFNRIGVFATDLDFVIQTEEGAICCLAEVKDHRGSQLSERQAKVYLQIADSLGVPFYYIKYTHDFAGFWLYRYELRDTEVIRTKIRRHAIDEECLRDFLQGIAKGGDPASMEYDSVSLEELH